MSGLTSDLMLRGYSIGIFPMAESRDDPALYWVDPDRRGVLPLNQFHIPKSLAKLVRKNPFEIRTDYDFTRTVEACAAIAINRSETWINHEIAQLYGELFARGYAHSIECWLSGEMVGGLYGIAIGGAFFGESMFSRVDNASKIALVNLVARLNYAGFQLLDTQFITTHLERFGAIEISRGEYQRLLAKAIAMPRVFPIEFAEELVLSCAVHYECTDTMSNHQTRVATKQ